MPTDLFSDAAMARLLAAGWTFTMRGGIRWWIDHLDHTGCLEEEALRRLDRREAEVRHVLVETYPCGCSGTLGNRCPMHSCP